ncbi:hypothetical protein QC763_117618 [Podospora pseudopauciseta]|uniref:Uncharacterized protein n=2 Tax=Podospora TaxID=5144 RepID=A0ABR0I177_9PEZI|nr:hypothetical protein QC763_117618 [Podospora pseudopauciseta]KAK4682610.1 hypothetical protein QC764_117618 [Podospora pseudoanserina]
MTSLVQREEPFTAMSDRPTTHPMQVDRSWRLLTCTQTSEPPLTIVLRGHQLSLSACEVFQVKEKMEWNSILSRAANTHTASSCTR